MQWRWQWWRWATSGSRHRCRRVNTRLILSWGMSPRVLSLIPTMTYTWYKLRVRDLMVKCQISSMRRCNRQMLDIAEVEIWRTALLWMFLPSLLSSLFFTSLDLGPVQMALARAFTTSGDKSSGGGVSPCARSAEWLPYGTERLWDLWVRMFAYGKWWFDCFLSYSCMDLYSPRGPHLKRGII